MASVKSEYLSLPLAQLFLKRTAIYWRKALFATDSLRGPLCCFKNRYQVGILLSHSYHMVHVLIAPRQIQLRKLNISQTALLKEQQFLRRRVTKFWEMIRLSFALILLLSTLGLFASVQNNSAKVSRLKVGLMKTFCLSIFSIHIFISR